MSNEELVDLIQREQDITNNMLKLWEQNQGYITKVACKYQHLAELEDLMQESYFGLANAVSHYKPEEGSGFISYATFWIKQGLQRYIENCGATIRLPSHMAESVMRYKAIAKKYEDKYGEEPTDVQMCKFLYVSDKKLQSIKKALNTGQVSSLNIAVGESGTEQIQDFQVSTENLEEDAIKRLDQEYMKSSLWNAVELLGERKRDVLKMRYKEGKTHKEVAEKIGVNRSYIPIIEKECFRKLKLKKDRNMVFRRYYEDYIASTYFHHVPLQSFKYTWTSQTEQDALRHL